MSQTRPRLISFCLFIAIGLMGVCPCVLAGEPAISRVGDVLSLSAEEAKRGIPIEVTGVVTYTEESWAGQFFVQDETGGVFVGQSSKGAPEPGQLVKVRGTSHPGAFAPFISTPEWEVLGSAPLPPARSISIERFRSGIDDGLRVEVSGRVRRIFVEKADRWTLIMASGGQRFEVMVRPNRRGESAPAEWVGAWVRVSGVLAAEYQLHRRGLAMVRVFAASPDEVVVEKAEEIDPFRVDLIPLAGIGQYRRDLAPGQRSRVRGVVVERLDQDSLAIQDESGGLIIKGGDLGGFAPGDLVEAVGFEELENFLPILQDAVVAQLGKMGEMPAIAMPSVEDLARGSFHACRVGLDADLLEITERPSSARDPHVPSMILVLQMDGRVYKADYEGPRLENGALPFEPGSRLRLTGLCLAEANRGGQVDSFRLRLIGPEAAQVIRPPPWLNSRRLKVALFSTFAGILVCGVWMISSGLKNRRLRAEILEREALTRELEKAKQRLSLRVDERTEELNLQISERKESEVRFKAVIEERTRLAQELHDGLQQGLTGVTLQLDTAAKLRERDPESSRHHLELARTLMRQNQVELRSSVWNLRTRSQENFTLLEALRQSSGRITDGIGVEVAVVQSGEPENLSELQEENLLRIAQEALTNAIKHSGSERMEIDLVFSPGLLVLRVRDFGSGFSREGAPGPEQGHFGVSGMAERAHRIGGDLEIQSQPGFGTLVEARLKLPGIHPPPAGEPSLDPIPTAT